MAYVKEKSQTMPSITVRVAPNHPRLRDLMEWPRFGFQGTVATVRAKMAPAE